MSHQRRSIRLKEYDFSQNGAYFVTICTHEREHLFGEIVGESMVLNAYGEIVQEEWARTAIVRPYVELDAFVIMPNHLHGIMVLTADFVAQSIFVAGFKAAVTKRINELQVKPAAPVWQGDYYKAIIRSEITLNALRQYIETNPARWAFDKENVR